MIIHVESQQRARLGRPVWLSPFPPGHRRLCPRRHLVMGTWPDFFLARLVAGLSADQGMPPGEAPVSKASSARRVAMARMAGGGSASAPAKRAADLPVVELDVDGHQKDSGRATARVRAMRPVWRSVAPMLTQPGRASSTNQRRELRESYPRKSSRHQLPS